MSVRRPAMLEAAIPLAAQLQSLQRLSQEADLMHALAAQKRTVPKLLIDGVRNQH
jgi:hypothetical protein